MFKAKVCVVASNHAASDIRVFYKECRLLAEAGYDVTFVVPHHIDEIIDNVRIKSVPIPKNRTERFLKTTRQLYKSALKEQADIYHLHDPDLLPYAQLLRLRGKKVVYDMHENLPKAILKKPWLNPVWKCVLIIGVLLIQRLLLKNLPVIFAETSYKKDYPWVKQHCDVLNMPDLTALLKILPEEKKSLFVLGYIGGLTEVRGSIVTLESIAEMQSQGYNLGFECIGPATEDHQQELNRLVSIKNIKNVTFHGYLPPLKAWKIIASCDAGLAVLKPIPNYFESYPTKIFEYMALGIPVITSDFPLYKSVVETSKCGICIDPSDYHNLTEAIKWLIENPVEAQKMGQNGRKAVMERYNWENEGNKLLSFYKELVPGIV